MGFQSTQQRYTKTKIVAAYYGMSTNPIADEALVLGLSGRGPTPGSLDVTFSLDAPAGSGLYQYFAYPAEYGMVGFYDSDSFFYGGWDGANNNPYVIYGTKIVNVNVGGSVVPFYVYRTDWPNLGMCNWVASLDLIP